MAARRRWRTLLARLFTRWARVVGGEASARAPDPRTVEPEAGQQGTTATPGGPPAHWLEAVRQARPDLFAEREHVFPLAQAHPPRPGAPLLTPLTPALSPLHGARGPEGATGSWFRGARRSEGSLRGAKGHGRAAGKPLAPPPLLRPPRPPQRGEGWGEGVEAPASAAPLTPSLSPLRGARGSERPIPSSLHGPREQGSPLPLQASRGGESPGERAEARGHSAPLTPTLSPLRGASGPEGAIHASLPGADAVLRWPQAPWPRAEVEAPRQTGEASLLFDSWRLRAAGGEVAEAADPGAWAATLRSPESSSPGTAERSISHELQWPACEGGRRERGLDELRGCALVEPLTPAISPRSGARGPEPTRNAAREPEPTRSWAREAEGRLTAAGAFATPDPWPPLPPEAVAEAPNLRLEAQRSAHRRRLEREQRGLPWSA